MLDWLKSNNRKLLLGVLGLGLVIMFLSLNSYSLMFWEGNAYSRDKLEQLESEVASDPYNPSLLLEAARHAYFLARQSFRKDGSVAPQPVLKTGLKYYRRLLSNDKWHLKPRDYFYAGYLYHKLGDRYLSRAKEMALEAYNRDYRSRELIALLATLQFRDATSREEYQVALNYYRSLGADLRDPVLLYNKALTMKNLDKPEKALKLLDRGKKFLKAADSPQVLRRQYRLARVRIYIDQGRIRRAIRHIQAVPESRRDIHLRTLFARCLIELDRTQQARSLLKDIVSRPNSPEKAKTLLNNITENQQKARS